MEGQGYGHRTRLDRLYETDAWFRDQLEANYGLTEGYLMAPYDDSENPAVAVDDANESLGHAKVREWLDRQAAVTANELSSRSDARKTAETAEAVAAGCEMLDFDDSREKLAKEGA